MQERLTVAFVPGVTPAKWARIWNERMPQNPLDLVATPSALESVLSGTADAAFVRLPAPEGELGVIVLYDEQPVAVVSKEHPVADLTSVTLAQLADYAMLSEIDGEAIAVLAATRSVAVMPQSVARLHSRADVVARPVSDVDPTQIALVWLTTSALVDEFIGVVRGRTANSSRGMTAAPAQNADKSSARGRERAAERARTAPQSTTPARSKKRPRQGR